MFLTAWNKNKQTNKQWIGQKLSDNRGVMKDISEAAIYSFDFGEPRDAGFLTLKALE